MRELEEATRKVLLEQIKKQAWSTANASELERVANAFRAVVGTASPEVVSIGPNTPIGK